MTFPKITKAVSYLILVAGVIIGFEMLMESTAAGVAYFIGALMLCMLTYGLGEIVDLLRRINDGQN